MIVSMKKTTIFNDYELKKKKKSDEVNYNKFSFDCVLPVVAMDQPIRNQLSCISRLDIST